MVKVKLLYLAIVLSCCSSLTAQVLFSTSGNTTISDSIIMQWSIGEPLISTYEVKDAFVLTQGFNQPIVICDPCTEPIEGIHFSEEETNKPSESITVYPNPVDEILHMEVTFNVQGPGYIALLDGSSRVIRLESIDASTDLSYKSINVDSYFPGRYYIKIFNGVISEATSFIKL